MFHSIINWFKSHNIYSLKFYNGNAKIKRWFAIFGTSIVATLTVLALLLVLARFVILPAVLEHYFLSKMHRPTEDLNIQVSEESEQIFKGSETINIMLYGIDSRNLKEVSRSDSIMLITIDKKNTKIKMTSIARDTYVDIKGYGKDKINHAFAYGWSAAGDISGGAKLALETANNAFTLNVTDYVAINFWGLAHIIDYMGGVEIDIPESVRWDMNRNYIPHMNEMGIKCSPITKTGRQTVTGGQAVAFCRVRYVDGGDVGRGRRQREVISAIFDKAKGMSINQYMELAQLALKECSTSLTAEEILDMGQWAILNYNNIKIENLGLPTKEIDTGGTMIDGVWYYTYDLKKATEILHDFILEKEE